MGILDSLPVATQKQLTDQTGSPGLDPSMRASVATDVKVEVLDGVLSVTVGDYRSLGKNGGYLSNIPKLQHRSCNIEDSQFEARHKLGLIGSTEPKTNLDWRSRCACQI